MINSSLKVYGTMWYFGIWNAAGFLFLLIFLRETKGLTDAQKMQLYAPISKTHTEINL